MIQLLSEGDVDDSPVTSKSTSVRNLYKRLWEERGIIWPSATTRFSPYSKSQQGAISVSQRPGDCRSTDELREQEEFLLNMAMKESLKSCTGSATVSGAWGSGELANSFNNGDLSVPQEFAATKEELRVVPDEYRTSPIRQKGQSSGSGLSLLVDAADLINI